MDFLLDANAVGDAMREHPVLAERLVSVSDGDRLIICPIVSGEVLYGLGRLPEGKRKKSYQEKAEAVQCRLVRRDTGKRGGLLCRGQTWA